MAFESQGNFGHNRRSVGGGSSSMYGITVDLDTSTLQTTYGNPSWNNAYGDIKKVLTDYGFYRQQGSVYFGDEGVDAVTCVVAVQDLAGKFAWFTPSVRDIRMLRIEDDNDLRPALDRTIRARR